MTHDTSEIAGREQVALAAIRDTFIQNAEESGAFLFVAHHLEELDAVYWRQKLGTDKPEPMQILDLLRLQSHWSSDAEDGIEIFDFELPGDISNYVISVQFDKEGSIQRIVMES